ncbi:MAG: hypothetical protein ABJB22_00200 [Verrucomicrobiota bacterium]
MNKLRYLAFGASLLLGWNAAQSTTVIPPTFDKLVGNAEIIFQGSVTTVRSQWVGEGAQRHIASYVTFKVEDALKGEPGTSYTIQMLGGTVDGETMEVSESPKFAVGDRDILFVEHNGQQFIPLVGIMHGRFRIQREAQTGREIIVTNEGARLTDPERLGKETNPFLQAAAAISSVDFKGAIQKRLHNAQIK